MGNIYEYKWGRRFLRFMNAFGLAICICFMLISLVQFEPFYTEMKNMTTTIVFVALSTWLMSMLLNNLSSIDVAEKKSKEDQE